MATGQIFQFRLQMKRGIVHDYRAAFRNRFDQNFAKPLGKKRPRHVLDVTEWRDDSSAQSARDDVRSLKMSAAFDIFDFFPAKCPSKLAHKALIYTTFIDVNPLFFRYFRQVLQALFPFFFGFFSVSERLFFSVIPIFFRA